jgi:hypothetical protein
MRTGDVEDKQTSKWNLLLVSTRAGITQDTAPQRIAKSKMARLTARVSLNPLSSWIGKQLVGQTISKHHLDENGILSTILEGSLMVSWPYHQRIRLDLGLLYRKMSRKTSSRPRTLRFIIRGTRKCYRSCIRCTIGRECIRT